MGCLGLKNTFTYSIGDQTGVEQGLLVYQRVMNEKGMLNKRDNEDSISTNSHYFNVEGNSSNSF
jgi:hypothetical protein